MREALEGSIAVTGALVQWLRDNLGIISSSGEVEALAREVEDNGDVYFVPAFSGLYAPHWKESARGVIAGLTWFDKLTTNGGTTLSSRGAKRRGDPVALDASLRWHDEGVRFRRASFAGRCTPPAGSRAPRWSRSGSPSSTT